MLELQLGERTKELSPSQGTTDKKKEKLHISSLEVRDK
jgi:hypothetical protein